LKLLCQFDLNQNPFCTKVVKNRDGFFSMNGMKGGGVVNNARLIERADADDMPTCSFDDGCFIPLKRNHVGVTRALKRRRCEAGIGLLEWWRCAQNPSSSRGEERER